MSREFTMYTILSATSLLIRQYMLPNPFDKLPVLPSIDYLGISLQIPPFFMMLFAEPFIYIITFAVVGIYYRKGIDHPAKGSFLYLLFYCVHILALSIMAQFQFTTMAIVLVISGYIACQIGVATLANKIQTFSSYGF